MTLRPLDRDGRRAYLEELRPRFLSLGIRSGHVNLRWWVPMWAVEEPLRFALRALPLVRRVAPWPSRRPPRRAASWPGTASGSSAGVEAESWFEQIDAWFSEGHRDLLAMPAGRPLLDITTPTATIVIQEVRVP